MSLAMYAAPFNNNNDNNNNNDIYNNSHDTPIARKKNNTNHNKTQKRTLPPDHNSPKVNAVLQTIHNSSQEENDLGDYNLIPPPSSSGVENTKIKEGMTNANPFSNSNTNMMYNNNSNDTDTDNDTDNIDLHSIKNNYMNDKAVEKYYKNLIPNYNHSVYKTPYYNPVAAAEPNTNTENYNSLVNKLNYMINLLEDQQDEKTNNVTEEVVLYSFLGIFIIFIVDSFARVGKYVR